MKRLNDFQCTCISGGVLNTGTMVCVVPSTGIPEADFNAIEYAMNQYYADNWCHTMVENYLGATGSLVYLDAFDINFEDAICELA